MRKRLGVASAAAAFLVLAAAPVHATIAVGTGAGVTALAGQTETEKSYIHQAQFTIQLGGGAKNAVRKLRQQGYTDIRIVKSGLTKTIAEACLKGDRIRLVLNALGGIRDSGKIGECAGAGPDYENLRLALRDRGYRRIEFTGERRRRGIEATACREGREFLLIVREDGRIRDASRTGRRCGPVVDIDAIRAKLRDRGFNRIEFTSTQPPVIRAQACRRGRKINLRISPNGDIRQAARIGRCPAQPR